MSVNDKERFLFVRKRRTTTPTPTVVVESVSDDLPIAHYRLLIYDFAVGKPMFGKDLSRGLFSPTYGLATDSGGSRVGKFRSQNGSHLAWTNRCRSGRNPN